MQQKNGSVQLAQPSLKNEDLLKMAAVELDRIVIKYQLGKNDIVSLAGMIFNLSLSCTLLE